MKNLYVTSIGINVVLAVIATLSFAAPGLFTLGDDCDYGKEFLKIKEQFGKRYYDLPLEQRMAIDHEFSQIDGSQTQEEFDLEYDALLDKYGIVKSGYTKDEVQSLFYQWVKICQDG